MRVAYCYVTSRSVDGDRIIESAASIRALGVTDDIFVCTADNLFARPLGLRTADLSKPFRNIFGRDANPSACFPGDPTVQQIEYGKYVLPFVAELHRYERLVVLDPRIRAVTGQFTDVNVLAFPAGIDTLLFKAGSTADVWFGQKPDGVPDYLNRPGVPWYGTDVIVLRGGGLWMNRGYQHRLRQMRLAAVELKYRRPAESGPNLHLAVGAIPPSLAASFSRSNS